jgi:hypothetical protein
MNNFELSWNRCFAILKHYEKQINTAPRAAEVLHTLRQQTNNQTHGAGECPHTEEIPPSVCELTHNRHEQREQHLREATPAFDCAGGPGDGWAGNAALHTRAELFFRHLSVSGWSYRFRHLVRSAPRRL